SGRRDGRLSARAQLGASGGLDREARPGRPGHRRRVDHRVVHSRPPPTQMMITLASGFSYVDVRFLGVPGVIATAVLHGPAGVALVDPGPSSTLGNLEQELRDAGIAMTDVRTLLLTHIHLDHGGATGTLVRNHPHLRVYVHEKGAPHMADPEKLLASAKRLYGDDMDRLWGEVLPVPRDALVSLSGGERISAGGRALQVAYTPGHASHHVSYFSSDS